MDSRPEVVKRFEIIYFASIFLGIVIAAMTYQDLVQQSSPFMVGFIQLFTFAFMLWLITLISRKGSSKAKWWLVGLWAAGLIFYIPQLSIWLDAGLVGIFSIAQLAMQCVAMYFLFTPECTEWLKSMSSKAKDEK
jgi:hypothetical protein